VLDYGAPGLAEEIARAEVPARAVSLWWLGQASFALKGAGATIYIDPYLAVSPRRLSPPPFPPDAVSGADLILLTHDHLDHIDPSALPGIAAASPAARFVAPRPHLRRVAALIGSVERVVPADADVPLRLLLPAGEVAIDPVPAAHETLDPTPEGYGFLGYTIRLGSIAVHHAGDTTPYPGQIERVRAHAVDVALLPINGRDVYRTSRGVIGNMDYREAAEFAHAIGALVVVPMHYGMFAGNTVPPGHFVSLAAEMFPDLNVHIMGRFGRYTYLR